MKGINELGREINEINKANGWKVAEPTDWALEYKIPALLALVHSEVSEALEGFRGLDYDNFCEELADVMIRTMDLASGLGIDLESEIRKKMEKNKKRGYKHGGKKV